MNNILTTEYFDNWFSTLKDRNAAKRIQARIDRAEQGNFGDCAPVGEGVSEMRIHYGPGFRIYFVQQGLYPSPSKNANINPVFFRLDCVVRRCHS